MSVGSVTIENSKGESVPYFSPNLWWLLAILDIPWLEHKLL